MLLSVLSCVLRLAASCLPRAACLLLPYLGGMVAEEVVVGEWLEGLPWTSGWTEVVTLERCFDSFSTAVLLQRRVLECSSLTASTTACSPSVAYTVVTTCNHQDQCHHMHVTTSPSTPLSLHDCARDGEFRASSVEELVS